MGKAYTRFQTKTTQKPYPIGRHIPHPRAIADHVTSAGHNMKCSLLHSRFKSRHGTLLPTNYNGRLLGGALRDETKNGCVADYMK